METLVLGRLLGRRWRIFSEAQDLWGIHFAPAEKPSLEPEEVVVLEDRDSTSMNEKKIGMCIAVHQIYSIISIGFFLACSGLGKQLLWRPS